MNGKLLCLCYVPERAVPEHGPVRSPRSPKWVDVVGGLQAAEGLSATVV